METTEHLHTTPTPQKQEPAWLKGKITISQIKVINRHIITLRHQMKKHRVYFLEIIPAQINIPQIKIIIIILIKIIIALLIMKIKIIIKM